VKKDCKVKNLNCSISCCLHFK